ncbi:hypothetical protein HYV82_05350 [Candidatus Woesearchaeota archaeon]|nr:hypothetical protein [Candidatus Woesearchaeota archaeon]
MAQYENGKTIEQLELELAHFRQSMNEWVLFLNEYNRETRQRIMEMEKRLAKLEMDSRIRF